MHNKLSTLRVKKPLLWMLGISLLFLSSSLYAYNNAWSDNEDYVVPSETNIESGEGNENEEIEGTGANSAVSTVSSSSDTSVANVSKTPTPPVSSSGNNKKDCPVRTGSPVYIKSGHFIWTSTDIILPGKSGIFFSRTYTSKEPLSGMFGNGWISNLESGFIETIKHQKDDGTLETHYIYRKEDGLRYTFKDINGTIESPNAMKHTIERLSDTSFKVTDINNIVDIYTDDKIISKEDIHGNKREYIYDENSLLQSIKDSNGNTLTLTYGANGYVTAISDNNDRIWKYAYDGDGNLISVTNPLDGVRKYSYEKYQADNDAQFYFHLTKITDEEDVVVAEVIYNKDITGTYSFQNARVKSYTEGENNNTYNWNYLFSYEYVTKTDSSNKQNHYYLSDSGHVTKYKDSYSKTTTYNIDENMTFTGVTDKMGNEWNQSVDTNGRVISTTTPLGSVTTYEYDGDKIDPSKITSPLGHITQVSYDTKNNPIAVTLADNSIYRFTYDAKGNVLDTTNPSGDKTSTIAYNANSQPISVKNALNDTYTMTYNALGQRTTFKDGEGNTITYTYDLLGYLTKVVNAMNQEIVYTYDKAGKLLSLKDPAGNTTSYEYDTFGRVSKVIKPNGRTLSYTYNTLNLVTAITDSVGSTSRETTFEHDSLRRVTYMRVGSLYKQFSYDYLSRVTRAYNSESGQYIYYTYNADGQVTQEKQHNKVLDYTYDLDGNLATMKINDDTTVTYTRNSIGNLESLSDGVDTFEFTYDANGMRKGVAYPNGKDTAYTLDSASRLAGFNNGLTQNSYIYNKNGMLTQKTVGANPAINYDYDKAGRVSGYSYDSVGNILDNSATYDTQTNELISTATHTYEYDDFGNLIKKTEKSSGNYKVYSWSAWNQLKSVESFDSGDVSIKTISFTYGAMGRRLSKTVDGVVQKYLYSGANMVAIMNNYSTITHRILHDERVDSPLAIYDVGAAKSYYYHKDHLGSIVGLSDSAGNSVESYTYDVYGQTVKSSSVETGNPFGFSARELDDDDLYYYRARYYDPTTGRFLSEDPLGFVAGDFNLYRYVLNNPLNHIDPYGYGFWGFVGFVTVGAIAAPAAGAAAVTGAVVGGVAYTGYTLWNAMKEFGEKMKRNIKRRQEIDSTLYSDNPDSDTIRRNTREGLNEVRDAIREGYNLPGTFVGGPVITGVEDVIVGGVNEILIPNVYTPSTKKEPIKKTPCQ